MRNSYRADQVYDLVMDLVGPDDYPPRGVKEFKFTPEQVHRNKLRKEILSRLDAL